MQCLGTQDELPAIATRILRQAHILADRCVLIDLNIAYWKWFLECPVDRLLRCLPGIRVGTKRRALEIEQQLKRNDLWEKCLSCACSPARG